MATRAPGALSRTRALGAQAGQSQDPAWSPYRLTQHADPLALQRPSTYLRTRAAGSAALTDPGSGEEEERAAVPISHCAGRVPVPASPPLSSAVLGLDTVFACGLEGLGEKVFGVLVLLANSPLIPREIIARHGNCPEKSRLLLRRCGWKVKVRGGRAAAAFLEQLVCLLGEKVDCSASSNLRQRPLVPGLARAACT